MPVDGCVLFADDLRSRRPYRLYIMPHILNSAIICSGHCMHGPIFTSKCINIRWRVCLRTSNRLTRHHSVSRGHKYSNSPVGRALFVCSAQRDAKRVHQKQQTEQSKMAESELIYFMFQLVSACLACWLNWQDANIEHNKLQQSLLAVMQLLNGLQSWMLTAHFLIYRT